MAQVSSNVVKKGSIVDYLSSQGQKSDYSSRSNLASQYGIKNYTGTAEQNTGLLAALQKKASAPTAGVKTGVNGQTINQLMSQGKNVVMPENKPGIVPQVYSGSTGIGSNQNVSTNKYGGYTQPIQPTSVNTGSNAYQDPTSKESFDRAFNALTPQQQKTYRDANPELFSRTNTQPNQNIPQAPQSTTQATTQPLNTDTSYQGLLSQLLARSQQNNPELDKSIQALKDFQTNYSKSVAGVQSHAIPIEFQQGQQQVMANQYSSALPAYQNAVTQQQSNQAQQLSALSSALSAAAPRQQGYVMIDPTTGQPVGGSATGMAAAALGGQYSAAESGGVKYGSAQQEITGAQNNANQLNQVLINAGINPNDIAATNAFISAIQREGMSNPNYTTYKNAINAINSSLSNVLGSSIDVEALARQKGDSIADVIQNQLQIARGKAEGYKTTGGTSTTGGKVMFGSFNK